MSQPRPDRYERVRVDAGHDPNGRPTGARTVLLRVTDETGRFLTGVEVRPDGDEVSARGYDERVHVIDKAAIRRRTPMRMNLAYGELEPDEH